MNARHTVSWQAALQSLVGQGCVLHLSEGHGDCPECKVIDGELNSEPDGGSPVVGTWPSGPNCRILQPTGYIASVVDICRSDFALSQNLKETARKTESIQ